MLERRVAPPAAARIAIATSRLVLREPELDDWSATLDYQRQPGFLDFYEADDVDEDGARGLLERFVLWRKERPRYRYQLVITLRDDGSVIGNVGIRMEAPYARIAELGYEIAPMHWGRGYATEAANAMLKFAFERLCLRRVASHCIAENTASARVLTKIGMQPEGRMRAAQEFKGRRWDVLLFGILDTDWRERRAGPSGASAAETLDTTP